MVNFRSISTALAATSLIGSVTAHPGEVHTPEEIAAEHLAIRQASANWARSLEKCAASADFQARKARAVARRAEVAKSLRAKRSLEAQRVRNGKRDAEDLAKWAAVDHNQTSAGYSLETDAATLFATNSSCVLVNEVTIGPYYVSGELIRQDVTEDQAGVPLHLELQYVDVNDCAAVTDILVDLWHCNATGVYSGVSAQGQGGLDSTFLRGVERTDSEGVIEFDTVFPGHYTGRATHIHIMSTHNATILANDTYSGGTPSHIGQIFFDQALISQVEATTPYSSNAQELTTNLEDNIAQQHAAEDYDVFADYALLGDSIEDGLMAWIIVGINSTADYTSQYNAAAHYQQGGGVEGDSFQPTGGPGGGMGGGPGGAPPSGTMGGARPTGNGTTSSSAVASTVLSSGANARRFW